MRNLCTKISTQANQALSMSSFDFNNYYKNIFVMPSSYNIWYLDGSMKRKNYFQIYQYIFEIRSHYIYI